jgi:flavin reductase (DIM6/NTAB) family NADH-FMN oxidoreductase RutF
MVTFSSSGWKDTVSNIKATREFVCNLVTRLLAEKMNETSASLELSPRAAWLYRMRLDDLWASLLSASLPPASGLAASSCSYGREFASRFFQLHLTATPCGSLRLPSSAPIGSFHPMRFCPCWAHRPARAPLQGTT